MKTGNNLIVTNRIFLFLLFLLAGCSSEFDKMMTECEELYPGYAEQMTDIQEEWADTFEIAASTSRIALSGPVGELQSIRREANNVNPPECIVEDHDNYIEAQHRFIGFFLDFMSDPDTELDDMEITIATIPILGMELSLESYEQDPEAFFEELRGYFATATAEAE